jgi:alpha/beta superfamily hydrolase
MPGSSQPEYGFSIPSLADDTPLKCRVYHPEDLDNTLHSQTESWRKIKGAIIAHPYAPLGGSYDDAVVLTTAETLLAKGFVVGTFNFRCVTVTARQYSED